MSTATESNQPEININEPAHPLEGTEGPPGDLLVTLTTSRLPPPDETSPVLSSLDSLRFQPESTAASFEDGLSRFFAGLGAALNGGPGAVELAAAVRTAVVHGILGREPLAE